MSVKQLPGVVFMLVFIALGVALLGAAGCAKGALPPPSQPLEEAGDKEKRVEEEQPQTVKVVLYFTGEDTNRLAGEERDIAVGTGRDTKIAVLEELIKGPQNPALGRTIPPDVKVLRLKVDEEGLAIIDFSRELLTSHWGGSMGEIMTVYSVVNTLAMFPDIEQVRFLVEGEEIETLTGHLDISEPVEPDWDLVEK